MELAQFPRPKRAIFRKVEEIKDDRGVVLVYVAQGPPQIDEEIAEKRRFGTGTSCWDRKYA